MELPLKSKYYFYEISFLCMLEIEQMDELF